MKRRRNLLLVLLLISALALGVGYAAVTTNVQVAGSIKVHTNEDFTVVFTGYEVTDKAVDATTGSSWGSVTFASNNTVANMDLTGYENFRQKGDTLTVVLTIKNTSNASQYYAEFDPAKVQHTDGYKVLVGTDVIDDDSDPYLTIEHEFEYDGQSYWDGTTPLTNTFSLAPDETATLTYTFTLNRTPNQELTFDDIDIVLPFTAINDTPGAP